MAGAIRHSPRRTKSTGLRAGIFSRKDKAEGNTQKAGLRDGAIRRGGRKEREIKSK